MYNERNHFANYVGLTIKTLKIFLNYLRGEKMLQIGDFHKCFFVPKENIPIAVLCPDQLKFLIVNEQLTESLSPHLRKIKDFLSSDALWY